MKTSYMLEYNLTQLLTPKVLAQKLTWVTRHKLLIVDIHKTAIFVCPNKEIEYLLVNKALHSLIMYRRINTPIQERRWCSSTYQVY